MPVPFDARYQLQSWPPTPFNRDLWNAVFGSIADRLSEREALEASFEALIAQGTQASLDYIQATIAPQIASLQQAIANAEAEVADIIASGVAPDAAKLGGQLPSWYAPKTSPALGGVPTAATAALGTATGQLATTQFVKNEIDALKGGVGSALDTLKEIEDKFASEDSIAAAMTLAINGRIPFYGTGAALPTSDIGPIWHADYAAIMTWDGVGYASVGVGESRMFAFNAVPAGFLEENGAAVSRTAYAGLFRRIGTTWGAGDGSTTFNLPDTRGEHIRAFDNGRGVDSGRAFASWQDSQNRSHAHGVGDPGHTHGVKDTDEGNYTYGTGSQSPVRRINYGQNYYTQTTLAYTGIWIQADGGSETRVRNVTRKFCIKF